MKLGQTREARALAIAAASRGLIGPQALWDAACRIALGGVSTARELFQGLLTSEQIDQLLTEIAAEAPCSEGDDIERAAASKAAPVAPAAPQAPAVAPPLAGSEGARYDLGASLGTGGAGMVVKARDREISRVVALKTLKLGADTEPGLVERFLAEARITAQLEHPNIIPVYDLGQMERGLPFYTMRVVKEQSLQDVLTSPELRRQWPLVRLVGAFVQVSRALAYAHRRGVIHRDIKPENVLLGDYGEVYLADWGNAKLLSSLGAADPGAKERLAPASVEPGRIEAGNAGFGRRRRETLQSGLSGTPGYIAPEQIRGDRARIDHRADIFALGVVLYEMLTGEHPFDAPTVLGVILATQTREPKPPRSIAPSCPLVLEDLCLAMLAKDPARRPASADLVASEAEAFLEGAKERARRREEATKLCELAQAPLERDRTLDGERLRLREEARRLLQDVKGYEPIERKRAGWELEDRAAEVEREQARATAEAIDLYTKALAYDPDLTEARAGLAELYWSRAQRADEERRQAERIYYEALVSEFDVGRYTALLKADAAISLDTSPSGAAVLAYRYVEKDRILVASDERYLGRTPLRDARLSPGSYLFVLKRAGYRDVRYPVLLRRGDHHRAEINLYTDAEIGEGFIYVPAGTFIAGGDPDAIESLRRSEPHVGDFAVARFPVTFREYCEFLNDLEGRDLGFALKRAPHDTRGSEGYMVQPAAGGGWEPVPAVIEGETRKLFPAEEGHLWNLPVFLIDWFDAVAYCRYRSEKEGIELRLPTELEWEKAARGTDGRFYPWGDHFDPTFCLMRASRPFIPQPEPVGTFPSDVSPYGVRDMAGAVREWVGDIHGEKTWEEALADPEPSIDAERDESTWRVFRSGNWASDHQRCRCASRARFFALARITNLSFRVAKTLPRGSR